MLRIIRRQISSQEGWRWGIGCSAKGIVSSQCSTTDRYGSDGDVSRLNSASKNICRDYVSKTRRDNRIRYFVVNQKVEDALDLLKKSVDRIPLDGSEKFQNLKYLKLPPSSVCNKVLHAAAKTSKKSIVEEADAIIKILRNQKVDIFSRTIITVFQGHKSLGQMDAGMKALLSHLDFLKGNLGEASKRMIKLTLSNLLETEVASRDKSGSLTAFKLMRDYGVTPTYTDAIAFLRLYIHPHSDDMRRARAFISWMWFNNVYFDPQDDGIKCFQDIEDWVDECGTKSVFSAKVKGISNDLEALDDVPEVLLAAAIGLCALEGNSILAEETKNKFLSQTNNGRILNSTLLHAYIRGGNPSKASSLIQDVRSAASIPDEILLQSLVLETYDRGSKSARDCLLELLDSSDVHMPKSIREMTVHNLDNC